MDLPFYVHCYDHSWMLYKVVQKKSLFEKFLRAKSFNFGFPKRSQSRNQWFQQWQSGRWRRNWRKFNDCHCKHNWKPNFTWKLRSIFCLRNVTNDKMLSNKCFYHFSLEIPGHVLLWLFISSIQVTFEKIVFHLLQTSYFEMQWSFSLLNGKWGKMSRQSHAEQKYVDSVWMITLFHFWNCISY